MIDLSGVGFIHVDVAVLVSWAGVPNFPLADYRELAEYS